MEESAFINKSLFDLSQLIQTCNSDNKMCPFRDSKIGKLSMDSFSGDSMLICSLIGTEEKFSVDYKTVQFAHKAKGRGAGGNGGNGGGETRQMESKKQPLAPPLEAEPAAKKMKVHSTSSISELTPKSKAISKEGVKNGKVAQQAGRLDSAVKHFEKVAKILPDNEKLQGKIKSLNEMLSEAAEDPEKVMMADLLNKSMFSPTAKVSNGNVRAGPMRVEVVEKVEKVEKVEVVADPTIATTSISRMKGAPMRVEAAVANEAEIEVEDKAEAEMEIEVEELVVEPTVAAAVNEAEAEAEVEMEIEVEVAPAVADPTVAIASISRTPLKGAPMRVEAAVANEAEIEVEDKAEAEMEIEVEELVVEPTVAAAVNEAEAEAEVEMEIEVEVAPAVADPTVAIASISRTPLKGAPTRVEVVEETAEVVVEPDFEEAAEETEVVVEPVIVPTTSTTTSNISRTPLKGKPERVVAEPDPESADPLPPPPVPEQPESEDQNDENAPVSTAKQSAAQGSPRVVLGINNESNVAPQTPATIQKIVVVTATPTENKNESSCLITILNSNDIDSLTQLKGIGPAKAKAIMQECTTNGPFTHVSELSRVGFSSKAVFKFTQSNLESQTA